MASRFLNRKIITNDNFLYYQKMFDKGVRNFKQYESATLEYPTANEITNLQIVSHIWKQGDSYEKLAFKYYQDSAYWWIIAHYNEKPTEQHVSIGESIEIPLPLFLILDFLG